MYSSTFQMITWLKNKLVRPHHMITWLKNKLVRLHHMKIRPLIYLQVLVIIGIFKTEYSIQILMMLINF